MHRHYSGTQYSLNTTMDNSLPVGKPSHFVTSHQGQLSLAIPLCVGTSSMSKSCIINRHITWCWCTGPIFLDLQCQLVSGWGSNTQRSTALCAPIFLTKNIMLLCHWSTELQICSITSLMSSWDILWCCSSAAEFPKFLGICMETFITLIDDPDVDIKMVADECLNRVIRVRSFVCVRLFQLFCCMCRN